MHQTTTVRSNVRQYNSIRTTRAITRAEGVKSYTMLMRDGSAYYDSYACNSTYKAIHVKLYK